MINQALWVVWGKLPTKKYQSIDSHAIWFFGDLRRSKAELELNKFVYLGKEKQHYIQSIHINSK